MIDNAPTSANARARLPPPRGAAESLVLQCRVLLAELAALAMAGGTIDLGPSPSPNLNPDPNPSQ